MCVPRPGFSVTASCPFSPGGSRTENEGTNLRWSLFCLRRSGRRGLKAGDTSSPIGHGFDQDLTRLRLSSAEALASSPLTCEASLRQGRPASPPVWMGSGWMTRPRSGCRGLLPGVEGARSWHEWLEAGLDVTALDFPLLGSSGSGAACPWKGLRRGVRCRSLEHWRGLEGFQRGPPPIRQAALYPGSRRGHMLAFRQEDIPLRPLCLREMLETPTRTAAGGGG